MVDLRNGMALAMAAISSSPTRMGIAMEATADLRLPLHVSRLASVSNDFVKQAVKLRRSSSYRHACGSLLLVGDIPIRELCDISIAKFGKRTFLKYLFVQEDTDGCDGMSEFAERVVRVTPAVMEKLAGMESTEGVNVAGITPYPFSFLSLDRYPQASLTLDRWCPNPERLLVLDGIQDPGNLGTLLRTAASFNWDGVFLLNGCCDPFNEKALRASRGACFWIPIACGYWSSLEAFLTSNRMKLYAGEPESKRSTGVNSVDKDSITFVESVAASGDLNPICLVLGNEGQGLSADVKAASLPISIPMPGKFESLNVAVAGGILLYMLQKKKIL